MVDPLTELVGLLRPQDVLWKRIDGAGRWAIRFPSDDGISFGIAVEGRGLLLHDGPPVEFRAGDFMLFSGLVPICFASDPDITPADGEALLAESPNNAVTLGSGASERVRLVGGTFVLAPADSALLLELVPRRLHLRASDAGTARISRLLDLIGDEATADRPGSAFILPRLVEVMLVEALRSERAAVDGPPRGLLGGLQDPQIGAALRAFHADVRRPWTVAGLAAAAHLSRSVFAARFAELVGTTPIAYLLAWRMALAKDALAHSDQTVDEIARSAGYSSASAFSNAFHRFSGMRPAAYGRRRAVSSMEGRAARAPTRRSR